MNISFFQGSLRLTSHMQNGEPVSFTEMVDPELTKGYSFLCLRFSLFFYADKWFIGIFQSIESNTKLNGE